MRCLAILLIMLGLSACSHVEFDEIASGGAGVAGCLAGSAVAGPAGCAVVGGGAAATTIVVTPASEPATVDVTQVETPEQAEVAKSQIFWNFVTTFVEWIIGACVALIVIAWLIPGPQFRFGRKE